MFRCKECGYRIRGMRHTEGQHHHKIRISKFIRERNYRKVVLERYQEGRK